MRAKVVLPPWFGPETTKMRSGPLKEKSLQTMPAPSPMSLSASARSKALAPLTTLEVCESAGRQKLRPRRRNFSIYVR